MLKRDIRKLITPVFPLLDVIFSPFTLLSSLLLLTIRRIRIKNMPVSKKIFRAVGVYPIYDHYYEPLFDERKLRYSLSKDRYLPGINWNDKEQLQLLDKFDYQDELLAIPREEQPGEKSFFYNNPSLGPGDAEYLYSIIRSFKPNKIIEIGSGYSSLMMQLAIKKNIQADPGYNCEQVCIEPYEMPWLEKAGMKVIRRLVENLDMEIFKSLHANDILFIDSSHMIRPQGDVLFEILEILPSLNPGVIIHVHDIFSPKDYTREHIVKNVLFWNEQYLLEAFLSCNNQFSIIGALYYLKSHYSDRINSKLPILNKYPHHVPGSFWIKKHHSL